MFDIDRLSAARHRVASAGPGVHGRQSGAWEDRLRLALALAVRGGRLAVSVAVVTLLVVAMTRLSPATAQLCAKLGEFPCGP